MSSEESNVYSLSGELEKKNLERDLLYELAALGANQASRSYDEESKVLVEGFYQLDNKTIFSMWPKLDRNLKAEFVDRKSDLILEWLKNG